jgi:phosphatidylglycerol---prolipoprotein diacylglyceryl transferase
MLQVLFRLHLFGHDIPVYGYGFMLVVAFLACVKASQWLARHHGLNPEYFVDATMIGLIAGIIGARLCHILENLGDYTRSDISIWRNLANMADLREGGLTLYGGLILATPCCIFYAIYRGVKVTLGMDIVAPVLMIGIGFGRIGCFLNGCCYGAQCDLPWGVRFPYQSHVYADQVQQGLIAPNIVGASALPVHPTQLYSSFTAFLLAALLIVYLGLPHIWGRVFALMLMLEGLARFELELIRVEPAVWTLHWHGQDYGMSISMILGLLICVTGAVMWTLLGRYGDRDGITACT